MKKSQKILCLFLVLFIVLLQGCSKSPEVKQSIPEFPKITEQVIVDNDSVSIKTLGTYFDDYSINIQTEITNKTEGDIVVHLLSLMINNISVDSVMFSELRAGDVAKQNIIIIKDNMSVLNISEIKNIRAIFSIEGDSDDFNDEEVETKINIPNEDLGFTETLDLGENKPIYNKDRITITPYAIIDSYDGNGCGLCFCIQNKSSKRISLPIITDVHVGGKDVVLFNSSPYGGVAPNSTLMWTPLFSREYNVDNTDAISKDTRKINISFTLKYFDGETISEENSTEAVFY